MPSPTTRTLDYLRADGWRCAVVEKFNSHTKTRHDLFGFIDILAIKGDQTLAIQATSSGDISRRVSKIESDDLQDALRDVREANWSIWVMGWKKYKKPVDRKSWRPTIIDLS